MSLFAGMSADQLNAALSSAQLALIALQSGEAIVSVGYAQGDGSKTVTRRVTTVAECTQLIIQLQIALGLRPRRAARRLLYL